MNRQCSVDIWGRAWLFVKFYINGKLTFDEIQTSGSWELNRGSSIAKKYNVPLGNGPAVKTVKVELYWDQGEAGHYLQDTFSSDVTIVKLYVDVWSPSSLSVEQGGADSSLAINFKNGGNDYMYDAKISVVNAAGLQIYPQSTNLENIEGGWGNQDHQFFSYCT